MEETKKDYTLESVVLGVLRDTETGRIVLQMQDKFTTVDMSTNTEQETNVLTMHPQALTEQLKTAGSETAEMADFFSAGGAFSFLLLKGILKGAKVTIQREYHEKGELRKNKQENDKDAVYTSNCYTSEIVIVEENNSAAATKAREIALAAMEKAATQESVTIKENSIVKPIFGFTF